MTGDNRGRAKQYDPDHILPDNAVLIRTYLEHRAGRLSETSKMTYQGDLAAFAAAIGPQPLTNVTLDDIAAYFNARLRRRDTDTTGWSLRSAHRHRSSLSKFYSWLALQQKVAANPVVPYELKPYQRNRPEIIPRTDINRLADYIEAHYAVADPVEAKLYALDAAIVALMNHFAMRVGAASGIEIGRIRRESSGELVLSSVGKGNKEMDFPLVGIVLERYTRWMSIRRTVTPKSGHEPYVFVHPVTRQRVTRQRTNRRLREVALAAGLDPDIVDRFTPHKFRHARARTMLDNGEDIRAVQSVLAHADLRTTMIYVEDDEAARRRALRTQAR